MKSSQQFYRVVGTNEFTLWDISDQLNQVGVTHLVLSNNGALTQLGNGQMAAVVTNQFRMLQPHVVNFVCSSYAELSLHPEVALLKAPLRSELLKALRSKVSTQVRTHYKPTAMDYVNLLSEPSALNAIQAALYKIQPYSLRKSTNQLVLDYFNSKQSVKRVVSQLNANLKTEGVATLLLEAAPLRQAITEVANRPVEQVSKEYGVSEFDLRYLSKKRK